ncbi:MAG: hypothetical protein K8R77_09895 [Anaerolineaceae bacterium]|nr:hypothetical protein [Anaerolineaceae bacterium]
MTAKKILIGLGALAVLAMSYCFWAYFKLRALLVPSLTELTPQIDRITIGIVFSIFIIAIFHLFLLVMSVRRLTAQEPPGFLNAAFFSAVIFSGILILSDAALLHDLGKEYLIWDVSVEWTMLFAISGYQLLVMLVGLFLQARTAPQPDVMLFERIRCGDDAVFISLNQVGVVCAVVGLVLLFPPNLLPLAERYRVSWLLALAGLAVAPLILIALYWLLRNRQKKLNALLDEKQIMDLTFGAFLAFGCVILVLFVFLLLGAGDVVDLNQPVFLLGLINGVFVVLFGTVLRRF